MKGTSLEAIDNRDTQVMNWINTDMDTAIQYNHTRASHAYATVATEDKVLIESRVCTVSDKCNLSSQPCIYTYTHLLIKKHTDEVSNNLEVLTGLVELVLNKI